EVHARHRAVGIGRARRHRHVRRGQEDRVVGGRGDAHRGRRIHRDIDGGGGRDCAVAVGRLRGQGVGSGRDVGPAEAVRGGRVRADQRRAAEELHLGNGSVRVGRGGRGGDGRGGVEGGVVGRRRRADRGRCGGPG